MRKLSEEQEQEICERHEGGETQTSIAEDYPVSRVTIGRTIRRNGYETRGRAHGTTDTSINQPDEDVFCHPLSVYEKYTIGFLLADGYILEKTKGQKRIAMQLQKGDKHILEDILNNINVKGTTSVGKKARLQIHSDKLVENLSHFGIVPRKTKTARLSEDVREDRHTLRGLIDGDGCISNKGRYPYLALVGSQSCVKDFERFAHEHSTTQAQARERQDGSHAFETKGRPAEQLIELLYRDTPISLDRKQAIADEIIDE